MASMTASAGEQRGVRASQHGVEGRTSIDSIERLSRLAGEERLSRLRYVRRSEREVRAPTHLRNQVPAHRASAGRAPVSHQSAPAAGDSQGATRPRAWAFWREVLCAFTKRRATRLGRQSGVRTAVADREPVPGLQRRVLGQSFRLSIASVLICPRACPPSCGPRSSATHFSMPTIISERTAICRVAVSACEHILRDLATFADGDGLCISYIPDAQTTRSTTPTRWARACWPGPIRTRGTRPIATLAQKAMQYTAQSSTARCIWYYGEEGKSALGRQFPHGIRAGLLQALRAKHRRRPFRREDDERVRVLEEDILPCRTELQDTTTTRRCRSTFSAALRRLIRWFSSTTAIPRACHWR